MRVVSPATEDEMVSAFLRAEIDSPRHVGYVFPDGLSVAGVILRRRLILKPDLESERENTQRGQLLRYRGFPDDVLFRGYPLDVEWQRVTLTLDELRTVKYAAHQTWLDLSKGSRLVADGAANYGTVPLDAETTAAIQGVIDSVEAGQTLSELILLAETNAPIAEWVLVEGHARATGYVVVGGPSEINALIGFSNHVAHWQFFRVARD